jgi:hypothetical protein
MREQSRCGYSRHSELSCEKKQDEIKIQDFNTEAEKTSKIGLHIKYLNIFSSLRRFFCELYEEKNSG